MADIFGIGQMVNGVMQMGTAFGLPAVQNKYNKDLALYNSQLAEKQASADRKENYMYGEMSADSADRRTRALFNDFYSLGAQMDQAKAAGLSPSMFASGIAGMAGQAGAQGTGASGVSADTYGAQPANIAEAMQTAAQIANLNADTKLKESTKEGKDIENADDPVIKRYIVERDQSIENANKEEAQLVNNAFAGLQSQLTQMGVFSEGTTFSISHGEGESESEGTSYNFNIHHSDGETQSFQIGGSLSGGMNIGITGGGANGSISGNYGKSHGENHGEGHGEGQSQSHAWAKHVMDSSSKGQTKSGNKREAENAIAIFDNQVSEIITRFNENRSIARKRYDEQVERYEANRKKRK